VQHYLDVEIAAGRMAPTVVLFPMQTTAALLDEIEALRRTIGVLQRGLTRIMREDAQKTNDKDRLQAWAGQSAALARAEPAGEFVHRLCQEADSLLS